MKRKNWDKLRRAFEVIFCCIVTFFVFVMCVYESARVAAAGWLVGWFVSFVLFGQGGKHGSNGAANNKEAGRDGERKEERQTPKIFLFFQVCCPASHRGVSPLISTAKGGEERRRGRKLVGEVRKTHNSGGGGSTQMIQKVHGLTWSSLTSLSLAF